VVIKRKPYLNHTGGIIVDESGKVFGVSCRSMEPQIDISFITPVNDVFKF